MPEPPDIDALDGKDGVGVLDAGARLDQGDDKRALVLVDHLGDHVATGIVIMSDAEAKSAHAFGTVTAEGGQLLGLLPCLQHRHHDAHGSGIEHRGDQVVGEAWDTHEGSDSRAAREGELRLQVVDADAAMLHVEEHKIRAGIGRDAAKARREELGGEDAIGCLSRTQDSAQGMGADAARHEARTFCGVTPTEAAADTICDQLSASIGTPLRSRSSRIRRSISPGRSTDPPGSIGGEALTQSMSRARSARKKLAPPKASGSITIESMLLTSRPAVGDPG